MTRLPAAQRREQLLDTAAKLFGEKGYSGSTTAELARAAGVTEPIIYRHFSSKKDLFIALLERTGKLTIQRWEQFLADAPDPASRLGRLIGANPMVIGEGRGLYRVVVQAMTEIDDEDILAALQNHITSLHKFLEGEIVKAQEAGAVGKSFSPEITAWLLMHLGLGYGMLAALRIPGHAMDKQGTHVRDVIERLMLGTRDRQY